MRQETLYQFLAREPLSTNPAEWKAWGDHISTAGFSVTDLGKLREFGVRVREGQEQETQADLRVLCYSKAIDLFSREHAMLASAYLAGCGSDLKPYFDTFPPGLPLPNFTERPSLEQVQR